MNNQIAFYAVDPEWLANEIGQRIEARLAAMQAQKPVKWMKVKEVAAELKLSTDHVLKLIEEGRIPAKNCASLKSSRADWRVRDCDLENF